MDDSHGLLSGGILIPFDVRQLYYSGRKANVDDGLALGDKLLSSF